jgi:hypothetical protein
MSIDLSNTGISASNLNRGIDVCSQICVYVETLQWVDLLSKKFNEREPTARLSSE